MTSTKEYEAILVKKSVMAKYLDTAIGMVRDFIIKKKLILYGGQAIDFALRAKGKKLYDDSVVPDYDVYSSDHAKDAYELGVILHKAGMPNVSVINALHIQTMKIRVDFEPVFDCSFIPKIIYDKLPTIQYNGFTVIHPHFQFIDSHLAIAFPFSNSPMEAILGRKDKDAKRFNMLYDEYPFVAPTLTLKKFHIECATEDCISTDTDGSKMVTLHGICAYAYMCSSFAKLNIGPLKGPSASIVINQDKIAIDYESNIALPMTFIGSHAGDTRIAPILDMMPEVVTIVTKGDAKSGVGSPPGVSIHFHAEAEREVLITNITALRDGKGELPVRCVNAQFLLAYLLANMHVYGVQIYGALYASVLAMLVDVEKDVITKKQTTTTPQIVELFIKESPFFLPMNTIGRNINASIWRNIQKQRKMLGMTFDARALADQPRNYYPARGNDPPTFDYRTSHFFQHDGTIQVAAHAPAPAPAPTSVPTPTAVPVADAKEVAKKEK
jgi:hypothetical protein